MSSSHTSAIDNFVSSIDEFYEKIDLFCDIIPPVTSLQEFVANAPLVFLYLVTLPLRLFLCLVLSLVDANILCVIYNVFPFVSIFQSLTTTPPPACNCPYCHTSSNCISIPTPNTLFQGCPQSIFNVVFCLIGSVLVLTLSLITSFINPFIYFFFGKSLCIYANIEQCFNNQPQSNLVSP